MTFIGTYGEAMRLLRLIGKGQLTSGGKNSWIANLRYALKTKTNPLSLNKTERKIMSNKLKSFSIKKNKKTLKKYKSRKSPPYPANENCNKKMKGNDGKMYISKANKNNVCSWRMLL